MNNNNETIAGLYSLADDLRSIANHGLKYSHDRFEKERNEQVLAASVRLIALLENRPLLDVLEPYRDNTGYVTPLIGAEAAVFRNGKLLLIQRHDDRLWAVPGGAVDVGETLATAALRELEEETGLTGAIYRLLGIFDSRIWKSQQKTHIFHVIFQVEAFRGEPAVTEEALDFGFFPPDNLPPLSPGHNTRVPFLFELMEEKYNVPFFDAPDSFPESTSFG